MSCIFLLTGWGGGEQCLMSLVDELAKLNHHVIIKNLPYLAEPKQWFSALEKQLPENAYWVGWSLGGQLLSQLTMLTAKQCLGLVTLASNVSFTVKEDWPYAMDAAVFNQFEQSYKDAPKQTIKRFLQLVSQGSSEPKTMVRTLQQAVSDDVMAYGDIGLTLLANLDTRLALKQLTKPQYHLFAEQDALVPIACATMLGDWLPEAKIEIFHQAGHAFVIQESAVVASKIDQFIRGCL